MHKKDPPSAPPLRPAGRPRSEPTRKAILRSAFLLLRQHGFDRISAQQIADHAGVSTATLYRWWSSKHAILLDAWLHQTRHLLPAPSRATPLARLRAYTLRIARFLNSENGRVFIRLLIAIQDAPDLCRAFLEQVFQPRRAEGCRLVRKAIAARQLPPATDPGLIIELLIGPQILRALLHQKISRAFAQALFDRVIPSPEPANLPPPRPQSRP